MLRTNIFYIFLLIFLSFAGYFSYKLITSSDKTTIQDSSQVPADVYNKDQLENSLYHSDENVNFDIPKGFIFKKENGTLYLNRDVIQIGSGPSNLIYIKVLDNNTTDKDRHIYDFLDDLEINKSGAPEDDLIEYFTYKRVEDIEISGLPAKTFINKVPYNFPQGTKQLLYMIKGNGDKTYVVGAYLGSNTRDKYYISEDVFDDFTNGLILK
jgi:hypothetical protein